MSFWCFQRAYPSSCKHQMEIYCCQLQINIVVNIERTQHEFQRISLVLVFDFQLVCICCGKRKLSCNYTQLVLKKICGGNLLRVVRGCSLLVYSKANSFADIFKILRGYIYQKLMNSPILTQQVLVLQYIFSIFG